MAEINKEYQKWYDRYSKGVATKEKHIDVLLEKGVITQEEYDSILAQSGYVERTEEPKKQPSEIDIVKADNVMQDELITTTMLATAEVNEQLSSTDNMTTVSLEALAELNEQIIKLQEEIETLKGGVK